MSERARDTEDAGLESAADALLVWWLDIAALVWCVALVVIGLGISTPQDVAQNAKGEIVTTGGTSLLVPWGALAVGVCIIVTQVTARQRGSSRAMPIAWVLVAAFVVVSLVSIVQVDGTLVPPAVATVMACFVARRRAASTAD